MPFCNIFLYFLIWQSSSNLFGKSTSCGLQEVLFRIGLPILGNTCVETIEWLARKHLQENVFHSQSSNRVAAMGRGQGFSNANSAWQLGLYLTTHTAHDSMNLAQIRCALVQKHWHG